MRDDPGKYLALGLRVEIDQDVSQEHKIELTQRRNRAIQIRLQKADSAAQRATDEESVFHLSLALETEPLQGLQMNTACAVHGIMSRTLLCHAARADIR